MNRRRLVLGAAGGLGALFATTWLLRGTADVSPSAAQDAAPGARAVPANSANLDGDLAGARAPAAAAAAAVEPAPLDEDALLRALAAIDRAYALGDAKELETLLADLVAFPSRADQVADWLVHAELASQGQACRGALLALEAAITSYERAPMRFGAAGAALVRRMLDLLPLLPETLRGRTIAMLQGVQGANGPALDLRFLRQVLALRREHPDEAEQYVPLLANLGGTIADPERRADFQRLFLEGGEDPLLVKVALDSLLHDDPATFLPIAEELVRAHPADARLKSSVAQAIAAAAPVDEATRTLARIAEETQYEAFAALASRPGAADAIAREYGELLAEGRDPLARKLLVSGLREEREDVLVGIARMDPDAKVSLQAALTLTARGAVAAETVGALRELFEVPADGARRKGAAKVAENVLRRSEGAARAAAEAWLVELVRDTRLAEKDRLDAYGRARRFVAPGTFTGVAIGGRVLE